jgi:MFS family permease
MVIKQMKASSISKPGVLNNPGMEISKSYFGLLFCICFISTLFGGIVSTLMSVYLPVVVTDLLGNKNQEELNLIGAYINAAFVFGWALGGFIWGLISDRTGRKRAVILSVVCYGLFTLLTAYMDSWWGVVICRFISGFGMGGVLVASTTIMIEEWPEKTVAIFMGILSIAIPTGIFSAGLTIRILGNWRQGFLVGWVPIVIALISIWLLKESVAWKLSRDITTQRVSITESIFSKEYRGRLMMGSAIFGSMLIGLWAIFSWIPTWIQGLVSVSDGTRERGFSMMIFGMGGFTGGFLSGWLLKAIGSKRSLLICYLACSVCSLLLFRTNHSFNAIIYPEIAGLALFFGASQGVLSVFIPKLFPTRIRATATGFCFNIGRIFTATAVLFVGVLESWLGGYGNALFIFSLVFILGLAFTIFYKEKTLKED